MAIQRGRFLYGSIGPLTYRVVDDQQIVSGKIKKGTTKQTKLTKKSAGVFGLGSNFCADIRDSISGQLNGLADYLMDKRLAGLMNSILQGCRNAETETFDFEEQSFSRLKGFEFNINSKLQYRIAKLPEVSLEGGVLSVSMPVLSIPGQLKFPPKSFYCKIGISVSLFRIKEGKRKKMPFYQKIEVTRNKEFTEAQVLKFDIPSDCLCITSIFLDYGAAEKNGWRMMNTKDLNPACILDVRFAPVMDGVKDNIRWTNMHQPLNHCK